MEKEVYRLDESRKGDFYKLHSALNGAAWCFCVAWWVPTWEGWPERQAMQNRQLRERLFKDGEYDGYLLYVNDKPVGWCQVGSRDRLEKLVKQFDLSPSPQTWAITCFLIAPAYRRRGLACYMLSEILKDLKKRNVKRVEAFPKTGSDCQTEDLWTGPAKIFLEAGFKTIDDDPEKIVMALEL